MRIVLVVLATLAGLAAAADGLPYGPCGPGGLGAAAVGNVVRLEWDPVAGASQYNLYRAEGDGMEVLAIQQEGGATTTVDTQVEPGFAYTYRATAVVDGQEMASCGTTRVVAAGACAPTLRVAAAAAGNELAWDQRPVADAYRIYRAMGADAAVLQHETGPEATHWLDASVEAGQVYRYHVVAVVDGSERAPCNVVEAAGIPEFPTSVALGAAAALGAGAYLLARRG